MLTLSAEGIQQIIETAKTPELKNTKTDLHERQANIQTFGYLSDEEAEKNYKELVR